ncbi:hypothetical protein K458DRAFT_467727 [Lentithecium fluviatile CBS 122367]|uniref:Uncharacterized protein n=1 Tax=Lentithecium fluviatile CBS 122367 TaxID=1168545 RepID=A0A6G1JD01_9PLEO|nr:hypothetical protein K458DRAFT_467727 [Lentithecium fluviatile CBS 122367]
MITLEPRSLAVIMSNLTTLNLFEDHHLIDKFNSNRDKFAQSLNISAQIEIPSNWAAALDFNLTTRQGKNTASMPKYYNDFVYKTANGIFHFGITDRDVPFSIDSVDFGAYKSRVLDFISTFYRTIMVDGLARFASLLWAPWLEVQPRPGQGFKYVNLQLSNYSNDLVDASHVFRNGTKEDPWTMEFDAYQNGFGWGFDIDDSGVARKLAAAVLGAYLLVALAYLVRICTLRFMGRYARGQPWQTIQELVALAANSRGLSYLLGTAAGIKSKETWWLNLKVRVVDEKLNLTFARGDEEWGGAPDIEK